MNMANPALKQSKTVTDGAIGNTDASKAPLVSVPHPKVLGMDEACELLGIAKPTMYKYLKEGTIPAFKYPGGRVWKFDRNQLEQWLKDQQQKGGRK